jgi:hypothetical protein
MRALGWVFLALYLALVLGLAAFLFSSDESDRLVVSLVPLGVLFGGQALFLFGAGTADLCRPIRKGRLWMPVLVAATMLALLAAGLVIALAEFFYQDDKPWFEWAFWVIVLSTWLGWGVLLWAYTHAAERYRALGRMAAVVFAGSLAELLATIPAHLVVRRRPGCFVGLGTMLGLIAGVYVMLWSLGPAAVLLVLRDRYRREKAARPGRAPPRDEE